MESWAKLQASLPSFSPPQVNFDKFSKGFSSSIQATKERLGQVDPSEITELPQEYKDLETRVDALRNAHLEILKITKVYETETYDYPVQIQESLTAIGQNIQNFAATNLKGTNLPHPQEVHRVEVHKTLPHALGRAAGSAANILATPEPPSNGADGKLYTALNVYATALSPIADARVQHDESAREAFLKPWQKTLSRDLTVAMKARQAVKVSRLELDGLKAGLKTASPGRQEHVRLEVENAEDDLVQKTEVAITLMKTVLENPEPVKNLNELVKAQLVYHNAAADALNSVQGEIEELSVAAEGEYRKSRA